MLNFQNILYPIVRDKLVNNGKLEYFKNVCSKLDAIKSLDDCEQLATNLYTFLRQFGIADVKTVKLQNNSQLLQRLQDVKNSILEIDKQSSNFSFPFDTYGKLLAYLMKNGIKENIEYSDFSDIETPFDEKTYNTALNELKKSTESIYDTILFLVNNDIQYKTDTETFDELNIPIQIYEIMLNGNNIMQVQLDSYVEAYTALQSNDATDETLITSVLALSDKQQNIEQSIPDKTKNDVLSSVKKYNIDDQEGENFIRSVISSADSTTIDDIKKKNKQFVNAVLSVINNNVENNKLKELVKNSLSKVIKIAKETSGGTVDVSIQKIIEDMNNMPGKAYLQAIDKNKGIDAKISDGILSEYKDLLSKQNIKADSISTKFFADLTQLLDENSEQQLLAFDSIEAENKIAAFNTFIQLLTNNPKLPYISLYYTLTYVTLAASSTNENVIFFKNCLYLFEEDEVKVDDKINQLDTIRTQKYGTDKSLLDVAIAIQNNAVPDEQTDENNVSSQENQGNQQDQSIEQSSIDASTNISQMAQNQQKLSTQETA